MRDNSRMIGLNTNSTTSWLRDCFPLVSQLIKRGVFSFPWTQKKNQNKPTKKKKREKEQHLHPRVVLKTRCFRICETFKTMPMI